MNTSKIDKIFISMILTLAVVFLLLLTSSLVSPAKASPAHPIVAAAITVSPSPHFSLAYNRPISSSNSGLCSVSQVPAKAVNGTWSYVGDNWCAVSTPKWIQIDLGRNYYITSVTIVHASAGGEPARYNTRDFTIARSINGMNFAVLQTVVNNTTGITNWQYPASAQMLGRFVRLIVTNGAQPGQENIARIYEVLIDGVPAP